METKTLEIFALCSYDGFGLADIANYLVEREECYDRI